MIAGFLYLRFVVGAKGNEQIPFFSYYQEFGNLEAVSYHMICVIKCLAVCYDRMGVILFVDQGDQSQPACTSHL